MSGFVWGACIPALNKEVSGVWNDKMVHKHSNFKELFTTLLAVCSFREDLRGKRVQILSDNITKVAYINHMSRSNKEFCDVIQELFNVCLDLNVTLTAKYLAGSSNIRADELSRQRSPYEWQLHPAVFAEIDRMWGPHTVDHFASMNTAEIPKYNSYFMDPLTSGVDALSQVWTKDNNFVNPPFFLNQQNIEEDSSGESSGDGHHTLVAKSTLVSVNQGSFGLSTTEIKKQTQYVQKLSSKT